MKFLFYIFLNLFFTSSCLRLFQFNKYKSTYYKREKAFSLKDENPFNIIATKKPNSIYYLDNEKNIEFNEIQKYSIWDREYLYVKNSTQAFDPYCPHMGANLEDGVCTNSGIVCPFHNRHFTYNNTLTQTPVKIYNKNIYIDINSNSVENKILDRLYYFLENNGFQYIAEAESIIECSIAELNENAIDTEHFPTVHGNLLNGIVKINYSNYSIGFVKESTNNFIKNFGFKENMHEIIDILTLRSNVSYSGFLISGKNKFTQTVLNLLGKKHIFSVQVMPGLNIQIDDNSIILFHSTPISERTTKMNTHIYKLKNLPTFYGLLETFLYSKFLEPDMLILSKKKLLQNEDNVSPFVLKWRQQYSKNFL